MTARAIRKGEAIYSAFRKGIEVPDIDYITQLAQDKT